MSSTKKPRTLAAAQTLLERYAELSGEIDAANAMRATVIAQVNAEADTLIGPQIEEAAQIFAALQGWWPTAAAALTKGKAKSIELGGCLIGTRQQAASLIVAGEESAVVDVLAALKWAKPFLRRKLSLDKTAVLKAIDGPRGATFAELGIERKAGEVQFFVRRADPQGVRS